MDAVKNEIIAGRSLREQDFKEFASVILLDEELSISLFESPQEAINKVVEVNGFSYWVIGVYTSPRLKGQKYMGLVACLLLPISPLLRILI